MTILILGKSDVAANLGYDHCIAMMREAMIALSSGDTNLVLRTIIEVDRGGLFGIMPGAMRGGSFGAKLISIWPHSDGPTPSHQGALLLFDGATGAPVCLIDAGELTALRTAAASAAATDALARADSRSLAILGTGEQAWRHIEAIARVRPIEQVTIWGRSNEKSAALAKRSLEELGLDSRPAATVAEAVAEADIVCTTTSSVEPILLAAMVRPGTHINAVGSSRAGPSEIGVDLVACSRFFADHRESVLRQGAEFLNAKAAGLIEDDHIIGEIGEVFAGTVEGRPGAEEITIYKSLGNIVQDLAAGWFLYGAALEKGFGSEAPFD